MADLLVVTGPPGAGKSTVTALMTPFFKRAALVPGDDFFAFWVRGALPPWLPQADEQNDLVLRSAVAASATLAAGGCPVIYDGVLRPSALPTVAAVATQQGLRVPGELHYALLLPSLEQCQQRVATRVGHGFTDAQATTQMHADFTAQVAELDNRHVIVDAPPDPSAIADLVIDRLRAGQLCYRPAQ